MTLSAASGKFLFLEHASCSTLILPDHLSFVGKTEFYAKFGFHQVAKPIMLADGMVERVSKRTRSSSPEADRKATRAT
jgi:hypothetical protein